MTSPQPRESDDRTPRDVRRLTVIVNPRAGNGHAERSLPRVRDALARLGLDHDLQQTRSLEHARELAAAAVASGRIAVAFGGDGLVGAVADVLRHSDGVLGVLPGGRGNDFARVLKIPLEPGAACEMLASGRIERLDLGEVDGRTFIGIASCGFDSEANRVANEARLVRGNLVYAYGALRALIGWRAAGFRLRLDGGEAFSHSGYTVAAANSQAYGGGMFMAPDASLQDGQLDVVLVAEAPKLRFLKSLPTVFKGEHVREENVRVLRGREVEISADRPFTMYADGDPIAELPVTVRALPGAVKVVVPA